MLRSSAAFRISTASESVVLACSWVVRLITAGSPERNTRSECLHIYRHNNNFRVYTWCSTWDRGEFHGLVLTPCTLFPWPRSGAPTQASGMLWILSAAAHSFRARG